MAAAITEPFLSHRDPSQSDSSTQTGAALTPQSDTDSYDGEGFDRHRPLEVSDLAFGSEADETFELQDRSKGNADRHANDEEHDGAYRDHRQSCRMRRPSDSTIASFQLYTPDEERAVVRKFDRRLVLFLSLCYMLSFLDRSKIRFINISGTTAFFVLMTFGIRLSSVLGSGNACGSFRDSLADVMFRLGSDIGNARIAGMEEDLQTRPRQDNLYEWALTSFYISYVGFEWMALLWKLVPAHIYVTFIVFSWGVIASLQSITTSYPVLIFLRTLLGIGEAAFTGVPFYLSFFFKRHELAFRTAIFISAAPLATSFASSLAWVILKLGENGPISPWRLLFLLEGFPSVVVAITAWSIIPDSPDRASYLTPREKKVARLRLRHEKQPRRRGLGVGGGSTNHPSSASSTTAGGLKAKAVLSALADPKAWITGAMFFLANMAYSSLPVFLPTILTEMGHGAREAQALTAVPFLVAFVAVLATAHLSDKLQSRTPFVVAHALASAAGYTVLALAKPLGVSPVLRYLAVYPAAVGFFSVVVLIIAWAVNNQPEEGARGGAFALLQVVGQCGPLVGTRLYPDRDRPFFQPGMCACAGAMGGVAVLALVLRVCLVRANRAWDEREAEPPAAGAGGGNEEAQGLVREGVSGRSGRGRGREGDGFRYML
ncbi:major facilitator superfamily transporter [Whalleya microplaca]|nr:major facilitator superfamily transporter [Whalleya microplaca]